MPPARSPIWPRICGCVRSTCWDFASVRESLSSLPPRDRNWSAVWCWPPRHPSMGCRSSRKKVWSCASRWGWAMIRSGPRPSCRRQNSSIWPSTMRTCSMPLPRRWRSKSAPSSKLRDPILVRLNKYISETGVCSRRQADKLIEAGRVTCNGSPAVLGTQVGEGDEVRVDGRLLGLRKKPIYIALNKPVGITCTTEPDVEGNVIDLVGHRERIFPIGRLDKESEGLILLTNDGDIVNEILRSENNHEKEYVVTVERPITDLSLAMLASGVKIMGVVTKPAKVSRLGERTFRIVL